MKAYIIHQSELGTDYWGEGCRFRCLKKNIKKEVVNKIFEDYGLMKLLRLTIHDCYMTTDTEV